MNKILSVFILLLLFKGDTKEFSWNEDYMLTWEDFKGEPDYQSEAVAVTASGITFGFSIKESDTKVYDLTTEVEAHFYPEHSWYKKERANAHILGHEQLHFNITELHVRRFRKQIKQLALDKTLKSKLKALHEKINTELASMQNDYDYQTNSSIDKAQQILWQKKIDDALLKLDAYKSK